MNCQTCEKQQRIIAHIRRVRSEWREVALTSRNYNRIMEARREYAEIGRMLADEELRYINHVAAEHQLRIPGIPVE